MIVGALKESFPGETRVAITPDSAEKLMKNEIDILLESGAGKQAGFPDDVYEETGVEIAGHKKILKQADVLLQVRGMASDPDHAEELLRSVPEGQVQVGMMEPYQADPYVEIATEENLSVVALELMPRISRAQSMDVLSSQANIGGYKAALIGAEQLPKMLPMMMTAAGTVSPANVFVIGAGVAGLQAIATAKRLGANVEGYDIRLEVKEQVESLGADFVELDLETEKTEGDEEGYAQEMDEEFYAEQRKRLKEVLEYTDIVITTANIPGRPAPELINEEMVEGMDPGSVIIDLAAVNGGNCELTEAAKTVEKHGVTIQGPTNLPATVPYHASQLYATNLRSFLDEFTEDGKLHLDTDDEIIDSTLLTHEGIARNPHKTDSSDGGE